MKLFSTLFAVSTLTLAATTTADAQEIGSSRDAMVYRGDANGDGMIDERDVQTILGYLFGGDDAVVSLRQLDVNENGRVTISDAVALSEWVAEFEDAPDMSDVKEALAYIFEGEEPGKPLRELDYNHDGRIDLTDVFELLDEVNATREAPGQLEPVTIGDLNDDGAVDIADFIAMLHMATTGKAPQAPREAADINGDGRVDVSDLTQFGSAFF